MCFHTTFLQQPSAQSSGARAACTGGSHLHKATCLVNTQEPYVHKPFAISYMRKMWLQRGGKPGRLKPDWGKQETLVRVVARSPHGSRCSHIYLQERSCLCSYELPRVFKPIPLALSHILTCPQHPHLTSAHSTGVEVDRQCREQCSAELTPAKWGKSPCTAGWAPRLSQTG